VVATFITTYKRTKLHKVRKKKKRKRKVKVKMSEFACNKYKRN